MDNLKKWVLSVINNSNEEECWQEIPDELISILEPIRNKLLDNDKEISNLNNKLSFYVSAMNSLPNPIFIKDDKARFVFFNDKYSEVFDIKESDYLGKTVLDLKYLTNENRIKYHEEDTKLIDKEEIANYETSFEFSDGISHDTFYWSKGFKVPKTSQKGLVGEIVDVSVEKNLGRELFRSLIKLQEANELMEKSSLTDPTTKLYNRQMFNNKIQNFLEDSRKNMTELCFLLADLDNFKSVNDVFGHIVGDEILSRFSEILKRTCRNQDVCIRYGGEEFLVVMPNIEIEKAECIAEKLCDNTREKLRLPNGDTITVSIGVTGYETGETLSRFITRVDKALYMSKSSGRDTVTVL